ncbi:uncharacterized protein [Mytilus edulis]|uniref:uncharacterized protein isoform X4 n=1 Tax=Mytilus edulis TaxID=6550 RepID=UPI0039EFD8EA
MDESARIVMCIGDIIIKREPDEEEEDKKCEATQQSESESRKADVDDSNSTFETGNSSYSVIKTETTEKDHGNQMNKCTSGNVPPGTCTTGNFPPGTCIYPAKNVPPGTCIYPAKIVPTSSCIHQAKKIPGQLNKQNTIKGQNYNVMRQLLAWGSHNRMRGKYKPDDINDMLHDSSKGANKQSPIVTTLADVVNVKPLIVVDPGKDYDYNCIECGKMLNPPFHQCLWQCKKCSFVSVCMISFKAHYNRRHNGTLGPLNKVNQPCIKDMPVDNNLLLCTCAKCKSFHSCNPKEMGDHLNKCVVNGNKSCFTVSVFDKTDSTHSAATTQIAPPNPVSDPIPPLQNVDSQESPLQASNSTLNGMLNDGYSASKILQKMLIEARHAESKNSSTAQEKIPSAQQSINSKENLALPKSKFHGLLDTPHQDISRDGQDSVRSTEPREKLTSIASYLNTAERVTNVVNVMHQEPGLQSQKVPVVSKESPVPRLLLANNDGRTAVSPQEDFTSENVLPHSEFNNSVPTEFKPSITPGNSDILNQNVLPHFNIENSVPTEFKPSVMPGNSDVLNHLPQNPTQGTVPRYTLNNAPNTLDTVPHVPGLSTEPSIVMINGIPHKLFIYNPQGADQNTSPMSTVYSTASHLNASNTFLHGQSYGPSETHFTSLAENNSQQSCMPQHLITSRANPVEENMATSSLAQVKVESTVASENIHFSAGPVKTESTDASENIHFSGGPVKNERISVPIDENVQFGTTSENNVGFQFRHVSQGLAKPTGTANYQNINNQPVSIVKFVQQQNTLQMQGIMEQTNVNNSQQLLQGAALSQMITPVLEMKDGKVQLKLCLRQPNQIAGGQIQSLHNNFVSLPLKSVNERDQHQTMQNTTQTNKLTEVTVLPDMLNHKKRKRKDTHSESEDMLNHKKRKRKDTHLESEGTSLIDMGDLVKVKGKSAQYRLKLKEENPLKYLNYLEKQRQRAKKTRENLKKELKKKQPSDEAKKQKHRQLEQQRQRQTNYIERKKSENINWKPWKKKKVADTQTRNAIKSRQQYNRDKKRLDWIRKKDRERKAVKRKHKGEDADSKINKREFSLMKRPAVEVTNLIQKPADILPETKVTNVIQKTAEVLPETKEFGLTKKQAIAVICQIMNTAEDLSKTGGQKKFDTFVGVPFKIRSLTITDSIPVLASGMLACRICPKQFWHLDSLLQHHDMELPEKRTDCGHVMSQLDCHVCLSRIDNWISATDSIICFCETCDKTYTSLLQFNHHVILLHGEQKQCIFCKKDFFRKREFRDHVCERLKKLNYSYKMDKFAFCYKMDVPLLQKLAKRKKLNVQKVKGSSDTNNGIISNNYEAEGDNCTHKLAENDNTHYLAEGSNGTCYLAEGGNGKQYLAEGGNRTHCLAGSGNGTHYLAGGGNGTHYLAGGDNGTHYLAGGDNGTHYLAGGDNGTHYLAGGDNGTHYLAGGDNGTHYLAGGDNGTHYLAGGDNGTHYLAGGDNGTHYLAGGDNGTHYLAGKKKRVNTKDSATKIVKTPSELFMSSYTLTDSESEKETYIVRRINNEAEAVTRINTEAEIVTNSNTEALMVANSNTETEMITNSNTEALMVANSNTEAEMVTRIKSEAEMVTNSNTEAVMLTNSNTEAVMVANSNTEAVMVANSNTEAVMVADSKTEAEMVTYSNTEAVMVTNNNTEAEMVIDGNTEAEINTDSNTETEIVANSNTEAEMVTRIKTEAEMINYSNTEAEIVTNSNTEAEMITNCNNEAEMVTRIKTEADIVTYSDAEAEIVANRNTEADIVFRSNTVLENFESHTQNNEIQLQDSLVKDQIKTTHVNCFCSPCKVLFTSLKKLNAHAWFVHTQRQCVICHTYFTNHLCMCNHECARVILQMKINPMSQIVLHFGSEDKILEKVRGHGNQWYVFVKDNPMTLEETKTKDLRLPCYCRTCKIGLISLSQLNNHIYDVHTTRAECIYCKMDFNSTEEMGDHFCEKLKTKLKENILTEITACPCLETYDKYSRRGVEMITLPWLRMSAKTLRQLAEEKLDKVGKRLFIKKTDEQKKEILNEILTKKKKKLFSCFENSNRVQFVKMKREQFVKKNCPVCSRIFFGTSNQSLYEHFYKKHQKDTKYCRFCQQAFFADNHECKKEKEESYMNRKENKKIKEELVGEESIKLQKCPQCSYIKNFCKENIHNQTCTRKACLSCENCRECEGKNCFYCGKIFHFESLTWRHVEKKHRSTKTGIFHCYLCNITINTLEQLQLHVKTVHPLVDALSIYRKKTKYRQCRRKKKSIEQRLADAKKQRKKYQEKHKDRYKCEVCQEKFTYYIMLRKHIANEHERETFGCNICNMQFKHKKTLERHQMKGHLQVCEKEKPKHTCFVCDKKYSTSRSLRRHNFKEHLIEDKHISKLRENVACEQCGKIVMRKCMRLHLLVHQEKEFMCEDCGEKFRRPDDLKRHRQKHLRKKYVLKSETSGYKCLICGLILSTNGAIKRHFSLKHSSEKIAIPCKICGRLYASKPVLDIHMKLKHSEKSFQCEICNKKFYYNYLLKNHVKIVHENYKPFQCDICNFRCYMKSALVSHMKYNH